MHSKRKGNIGQFAAALELAKFGYSVFTEEGDISKIDLIAEKEGVLLRVQCKAVMPKNGCITLNVRKCGPNYVYRYKKEHIDLFSLYNLVTERVYFIQSSILNDIKSGFSLRVDKAEKNFKTLFNLAENYTLEKTLVNMGLKL